MEAVGGIVRLLGADADFTAAKNAVMQRIFEVAGETDRARERVDKVLIMFDVFAEMDRERTAALPTPTIAAKGALMATEAQGQIVSLVRDWLATLEGDDLRNDAETRAAPNSDLQPYNAPMNIPGKATVINASMGIGETFAAVKELVAWLVKNPKKQVLVILDNHERAQAGGDGRRPSSSRLAGCGSRGHVPEPDYATLNNAGPCGRRRNLHHMPNEYQVRISETKRSKCADRNCRLTADAISGFTDSDVSSGDLAIQAAL